MPTLWGYGGSTGVLTGYLHKYSGQGDFVLVMVAPEEYGVDDFEIDADIWDETDSAKTEVWRYTSDPAPRDSVMAIQGKSWTLGDGVKLGDGYYLGDSPLGKGEGAYKDYSVQEKVVYVLNCLYKVRVGTLTIQLWDQTNGAEIDSKNVTAASWNSEMIQITAPDNCTTIRVKFIQKADSQRPGPFLVDNVSLNGNILRRDPDDYERIPVRIGSFHQTLSGRRVYDTRAFHYEFLLHFSRADMDEYESLRAAYFSNELLYFNDGEVPPLVESERVYDTEQIDFVGITNPSSTHIAYYDSSASLPAASDGFQGAEFSTSDYQLIDEEDEYYKETSNPTSGYYLYHKYLFKSSIASGDVRRFRAKVVCQSIDSSMMGKNGAILYAWSEYSGWVKIAQTRSGGMISLEYSTEEPEIATQFVDPVNGYVRLLLRSMATRYGTDSLNLRSNFSECEINQSLDLIVELSHKAILDENDDIIWVKNLTQGTTLVLGTNYTIAEDRRSITISGQDSGDEIEVKYNRYFEIAFGSLPETWLSGRDESNIDREISVVLETISESR